MSQAQKISLIIVGALLVLSLIFATVIFVEKNKLAQAKAIVESQLDKSRTDGVKKDQEIQNLNASLQDLTAEKGKLQQQLEKTVQRVEELSKQIKDVSTEKDKWQKRAEDAKEEQTSLSGRIEALNKEIAEYKSREEEAAKTKPSASGLSNEIVSSDDTQWAAVLKDKAGLQVGLDDLKSELSKVSQDMLDLRRHNAELEISLDSVTEQKTSIDREIRYKTDLANNLSLDLARAKNDQRSKEQRIKELGDENQELRKRIKQMVGTNSSLEKSMVRLNQDKRDIEKRMDSTEDLIHSKINEIWDIKNSIDQTMAGGPSISSDVELPPIMVNSQPAGAASGESVGLNGQIVSINSPNNFVILNIGQKDGLKTGDVLGVYRGSQYVGRVEVIQVRSDIAAADIKEQSTPIQSGDAVK